MEERAHPTLVTPNERSRVMSRMLCIRSVRVAAWMMHEEWAECVYKSRKGGGANHMEAMSPSFCVLDVDGMLGS